MWSSKIKCTQMTNLFKFYLWYRSLMTLLFMWFLKHAWQTHFIFIEWNVQTVKWNISFFHLIIFMFIHINLCQVAFSHSFNYFDWKLINISYSLIVKLKFNYFVYAIKYFNKTFVDYVILINIFFNSLTVI